jgi:hypothetical protein
MPGGKPSGVRCINLTDTYECALFTDPRRPRVCGDIRPGPDMCGGSREEAMRRIHELEKLTAPDTDRLQRKKE